MDQFATLSRLSARTDGVVSRGAARAVGIPSSTLDRWLATGRLARPHRAVYRIGPATDRARIRAGVLAAGPRAVGSHETAFWWWGLARRSPARVDAIVPRGHRRPALAGVATHQVPICADDVRVRGDMGVTSVERTLLDLAASSPTLRASRAIDEAVLAEHTTLDRLAAYLAETRARGDQPAGTGALSLLLVARFGASRSRIERAVVAAVRLARLPSPVHPYRLRLAGRPYEFDFAWPDLRLAVEVDGFAVHAGYEKRQADLEKAARAATEGWELLRVGERLAADVGGAAATLAAVHARRSGVARAA